MLPKRGLMLPTEAVIFDMDGILVDTEPVHLDAINAVLAAEGHRLTEEQNEQFLGTTVDHTWGRIVELFGLSRPVGEYLEVYNAEVLERLSRPLTPLPGVREVLAMLESRGTRLAVASSSQMVWVKATLRSLGLTSYFPVLVSGDSVARGKPEPDIYLRAASLLEVEPSLCLAVEDAPRGILAARRAGMTVVAVRTPFTRHLSLDGADYVLDSLAEFSEEWLDGS